MSQFYINVPGGTPTVPTQFTTDVNSPAIPAANNVNVFGEDSFTTDLDGI